MSLKRRKLAKNQLKNVVWLFYWRQRARKASLGRLKRSLCLPNSRIKLKIARLRLCSGCSKFRRVEKRRRSQPWNRLAEGRRKLKKLSLLIFQLMVTRLLASLCGSNLNWEILCRIIKDHNFHKNLRHDLHHGQESVAILWRNKTLAHLHLQVLSCSRNLWPKSVVGAASAYL